LQKDPLAVKVSQLSSTKTQLPYSYYSRPFCRPDAIVDSAENLGELLRGDRIENTPCRLVRHRRGASCRWRHSFLEGVVATFHPLPSVC
jgi:hypothetical protein